MQLLIPEDATSKQTFFPRPKLSNTILTKRRKMRIVLEIRIRNKIRLRIRNSLISKKYLECLLCVYYDKSYVSIFYLPLFT